MEIYFIVQILFPGKISYSHASLPFGVVNASSPMAGNSTLEYSSADLVSLPG